jgi:TrmH family RNA methyltransferase
VIAQPELQTLRRIASKANPRVKDWAALSDKAERRRQGLTLAEGRRLVEEGFKRSGSALFPPKAFLVSDRGAERPEAGVLLARARELGLECINLSEPCCQKITRQIAPDGLALVCGIPEADGDLPTGTCMSGIWLVADGVQDPGNAGALARTALAAGAAGCLFLDGADPTSPKFLRGSMGAAFTLPCPSWTSADFARRRSNLPLRIAIATADPTARDYRNYPCEPPLGIIMGGEKGVSDALAALADDRIHIPLSGGVESLNLAVAAGILLFTGRSSVNKARTAM